MGILTDDMKRIVREQRLGYVATVCPDGTANLSPKGTMAVWDDDHLVFADIRSPQSVRNIGQNASVEINVVDSLVRKGYRFKGDGAVYRAGEIFDQGQPFLSRHGPYQRDSGDRSNSYKTSPAAALSRLRPR